MQELAEGGIFSLRLVGYGSESTPSVLGEGVLRCVLCPLAALGSTREWGWH